MVTMMTPLWPGLRVSGVILGTDPEIDSSQISPVSLVTAGSNSFVVAVIDMSFTSPAGAGPAYGPISDGLANQRVGCTVPPLGVYEPAALSVVVGGAENIRIASEWAKVKFNRQRRARCGLNARGLGRYQPIQK